MFNESSSGTGFFIDEKYIATCSHVVSSSRTGQFWSYLGKEQNKYRTDYEVVARGYEATNDVAILEVKDQDQISDDGKGMILTGLSEYKCRKDELASGESIMLCGCPIDWEEPIMTAGVISTSPVDKTRRVLVSASIQHGNSGGPCFDENLRIIGLVSTFLHFGTVEVTTQEGKTEEEIPRNYGYVVPIQTLGDLAKEHNLSVPWLFE